MEKYTTRSILSAWKDLLRMGSDDKTGLIREIFKNNYELYEMIRRQVFLLQKYEDDFKDYMPIDDFIDEYEDMLNLIGITSKRFNEEWDDETDRKS